MMPVHVEVVKNLNIVMENNMNTLSKYIDHTILKPICTSEDVVRICTEAIEADFMAVCIPPCHAALASKSLEGSSVLLCSVIGFPLGYNHTSTKISEINALMKEGVHEYDVVVNVSMIKSQKWQEVANELDQISQLLKSEGKIFKLIFETAYLDKDEILKLADLCLKYKVDFLKTSTGFAPIGAEIETVKLIKTHIGNEAKIKASGGISDYQTAMAFIQAGADRIGTSSGIKILAEAKHPM